MGDVGVPTTMIVASVLGVLAFLGTTAVAIIGFFITRHIAAADTARSELNELRERVTILEPAKDKAHESDEKIREELTKIREILQGLSERIVRVEERISAE